MNIKVACIQMRTSTNTEENIINASKMIREASKNGANLIATPEMTSLLDKRPGELFKKAQEEKNDSALKEFKKLAKELQINLIIGSLPIKIQDDKCVNRSFCISKSGKTINIYDKIHMFDVDLPSGESYKESNNYQPGRKIAISEIADIKIGMTICYDLRFPTLYTDLAHKGAEIIAVPSSFTKTTGEAHWHVLLRARAIETSCFIIAPAQGGKHEDGRETYGHSLIINPWGEILAEADIEPTIIYAEIDTKLVEETRRRIPNLKNIKDYD